MNIHYLLSHGFHGSAYRVLCSEFHKAELGSHLRLKVLSEVYMEVGIIHFLDAVELTVVCFFKASKRKHL